MLVLPSVSSPLSAELMNAIFSGATKITAVETGDGNGDGVGAGGAGGGGTHSGE